MSQKLGSLARKLTKGGLDIFLNFWTLKTFKSNKPLKKARPFSSLVILMRVNSDRGPKFFSALWTALCKLLGINQIPTRSETGCWNDFITTFRMSCGQGQLA